MTETLEVLLGREPWPVPVASIIGGHIVLYGFAVVESTGLAAARLDLFDGADAAGLLAIPLPLGAGMGTSDWFGPQGLHFRNGLFTRVTAGAVLGSLWIAEP